MNEKEAIDGISKIMEILFENRGAVEYLSYNMISVTPPNADAVELLQSLIDIVE